MFHSVNDTPNSIDPRTDREIIESYIPIAEYIATVCGQRYEIVLHDLTNFDHTIIYIANSITDRKEGDSLLTLSMDVVLDNNNISKKNFVANICGNSYVNGKRLRVSDFYIRNGANEVIGLFSINVDITLFDHLENLVTEERNLQVMRNESNLKAKNLDDKIIPLTEMMEKSFDCTMSELSFSDPKSLSPDEKIQLLAALNNKNLFIMKGTVAFVAGRLNVSASTVYRYLQIIKQNI